MAAGLTATSVVRDPQGPTGGWPPRWWQDLGVCTDNQLSTTPAVTFSAKRLQHVPATLEGKDTMKKEVLQSSKGMIQSKSACDARPAAEGERC